MNTLKGYEAMYLLDPKYDEEGLEEKKDRLRVLIESEGGEVSSVDEWGKKKLSYMIGDFTEAVYLLIEFQATPTVLDEIVEMSNVEEDVIKHQIFKKEETVEPVTSG